MNATEIVNQYIGDLTRVLQAIDPNEIERVIQTLDATRAARARVFVAGNGGSAATASHLCTDLSVGLKGRGLAGFDIQSLSDNASIATAVSNDVAYEEVFTAQLDGVMRPEDVLIAISASGNSPNILSAVRYAKSVGATVVGCSGFDGGELKRMSDVSFHVATSPGAYGIVEDAHLVLNHILHSYFAAQSDALEQHTSTTAPAKPRTSAPLERGTNWVQIKKNKGQRKWQPTPNSST